MRQLLAVYMMLMACPAVAGTINLAWTPGSGAQGHEIHYGTAPGTYSQVVDVGPATTAAIGGLTDGQLYYFAALAYDGQGGESAFSNEVSAIPSTPTVTSINDSAFAYNGGGWSTATGPGKYLGDDHYTNRRNSNYTYTFTGTKAQVFVATAPWHGRAAIRVDGGPETTVDLYSPTKADQVLIYSTPTLPSGSHTIRVRCIGSHSSQSTGNYITGDRIDVTP